MFEAVMRERLNFVRQWCASPRQVASVTPSSRTLGRMMTKGLDATSGPVLELGPGTGVFTRALIERGVPEDNIALVELNPDFATPLAARYPKAQVHCMSATDIGGQTFFEGGVSTVISGLGFLNMPKSVVEDILAGVLQHLKPGGALVQFTYGPRCPVPSDLRLKLGLNSEHMGVTLLNFPPASVYRFTRRNG